MTKVAFLGLGAIGRPMAQRVADAGFDLTVWNRTAEKARAFAATATARAAATPAEAARGVEVVVICLSTSQHVESLLDGPDGLLAGLARGALLVDCTSGDPATSRRIATRLAARDVAYIDAPVSGGTSGAERGILTVMVGGDAAALDRARPVLQAFGKKIIHCGGVGAGDAVKAMNNAMLAIHVWSTGECLTALASMGVDPRVALDVVNASSGRSNTSENLFPERVLTRAFPRTFRLALLDKDIGIAAGVARDEKVPSPILQLAAELFRMAHAELGEEADHVEAVKMIEHLAGREIA
ncbi:MAG TPA: NAD(P)-dependent oxidoreductase [Gemmatimonadaceae bacterium]|nr:NAD(P)-dependent oxidoreductase [Gemmatimonadaceae bacterium]